MGRTVTAKRRDRRSLNSRRYDAFSSLVAAGVLPTYDMVYGSHAGRFYNERVVEKGHSEIGHNSWPCEAALADSPAEVFRDVETSVLEFPDGTVALVSVHFGSVSVTVAAASREAVFAAMAAFRETYPATYLQKDDGELRIPITFWTLGPYGPVQRMRMIGAQQWADIDRNYPTEVREQLAGLMHDFTPGKTGQLILWQGPPGTGKTWALRALASEWGPWAEFHYITDPDAFFVDSSIYMVDVLLSDSVMTIDLDSGDLFDEADPEGKWRVLILEDTGELLSANAKEKYGQGLSRLLNVVDGMIGQGLKVLCLVTTNDELGELNPAVRRPGRCASQIEFRAMNEAELAEWLGADNAGVSEATLAELYAQRGDQADPLPDDVAVLEASAASDDVTAEIVRVAADHADEAEGYGYVAWNAAAKTVMYVGGDWTDVSPIEKDMLAIDGVDRFEYEYEAAPDGWCDAAAEILVPENGTDPFDCSGDEDAASLADLVVLASRPLNEDAGFARESYALDADAALRMLGERVELDPEDCASLRAAFAALAAAHEHTVHGITEVLTASVKTRDGKASEALSLALVGVLAQFAKRPDPKAAPIHLHVPKHDLNVNVEGATVNVPEQPPAVVHVHQEAPEPAQIVVNVPEAKHEVVVNVPEAKTEVIVNVPEQAAPHVVAAALPPRERRPAAVRVEYADDGSKRFVAEYDDDESAA